MSENRSGVTAKRGLGLLSIAGAASLLLVPLSDPWQQAWRQKLLDLAHVPLFALLTGLFYFACKRSWLWALALSWALAILAEFGQSFVGRWANADDVWRGICGSFVGVGVWWGWQDRLSRGRLARAACLIVAALAWPVADAAPVLLDAWHGYRQFPVLCDFSGQWETRRWHLQQAGLLHVPDPELAGLSAGRIEFHAGPSPFAAASLTPVVPNWSRRRRLCIQLDVEDQPIELYFKVRDNRERNDYFDRFNARQILQPGRQTVTFPLAEVAAAPRGARLDLAAVHSLEIFTAPSGHGRAILLLAVWLE